MWGKSQIGGKKPTFYCHPGLEPGSVITDSNEKKTPPAPIRLRSGQALAGVTNAEMNVTGSFTAFRMTSWDAGVTTPLFEGLHCSKYIWRNTLRTEKFHHFFNSFRFTFGFATAVSSR